MVKKCEIYSNNALRIKKYQAKYSIFWTTRNRKTVDGWSSEDRWRNLNNQEMDTDLEKLILTKMDKDKRKALDNIKSF